MRILVATDAWHPQVNGVVRTLTKLADAAEPLGVEFTFLTPQSFRTFAMPSYRDVRLAMPRPALIAKLIAEARPDSIHIATEGPIGLMVRRYCRQRKLPFTTSFHTRFPEYVRARVPVPGSLIWRALRRFHSASSAVMAATPALARELTDRGFDNVVLWPRGVDTHLFHPRAIDLCLPAPVFLSVGRVAVEKNLEAFLDLDLPGTKVIVGDGPARASLEEAYPDAIFLGEKHGEALAEIYAAADVFVFPSKTDTFSAGGARERPSGRGLSGEGASRRDRRCAGRRARPRPPQRLLRRARHLPAGLRRIRRQLHLGGVRSGLRRQHRDGGRGAIGREWGGAG